MIFNPVVSGGGREIVPMDSVYVTSPYKYACYTTLNGEVIYWDEGTPGDQRPAGVDKNSILLVYPTAHGMVPDTVPNYLETFGECTTVAKTRVGDGEFADVISTFVVNGPCRIVFSHK